LFITVKDGTSNKRDIDATTNSGCGCFGLEQWLLGITLVKIAQSSLHGGDLVGLVSNEVQHKAVVDELVDGKLHVADDAGLARYELLLLNEVLLHAVEEELDGNLSVIGNLGNLRVLSLEVHGSSDCDLEFLALADEVLDAS